MYQTSATANDAGRRGMWRSRWAAIGAAVAVSFGAGGLFVAQAAPGPAESTIVTVTPERILDTRDPVNLGLAGPFASAVAQKLQVTGSIPTATGTKVVVPAGATGVLLNVTPVNMTANGFISIRPGDATGAATTSSLNFTTGVAGVVPNAVQVAMPTAGANAGKIDITYDAYGQAGQTTDILVDVVGYLTNTGLQQLVADVAGKANAADVYTKPQVDSLIADGPVVKSFGNSPAGLPSIFPAPAVNGPTVELTTDRASRLFIQLHHGPGGLTGCSGNNRVLWIEVDGVRVPSSIQVVPNSTEIEPHTLSGVTEGALSAGTHQVRPRQSCFSGTGSTATFITLVQGTFAYVSDAGPATSPLTGLDTAEIPATVTPCEGVETEGLCLADS